MADGISSYLANKYLGMLGAAAFTAPAATYVELHTAAPGANGTTAVSSTTTRQAVTWAAASGGSIAANNTPTWSSWAGTNGETVTDIAIFDASTTGNFLFSVQLTASKVVNTGDTLTLTSLSFGYTAVAS